MRKASRAFLDDLLTSPSVSGYEQPAQKVVRDYIGGNAERVETDTHGNVTAILNAEGRPRVQFAGHVDQIGFLVQHIEDSGYLRISGVGGHDMAVVLGQAVSVWTATGPVTGVIARPPVHLGGHEGKLPEMHDVHVDTGLTVEQTKERIAIGDAVTYALLVRPLGDELIASPGLDDKVGTWAVIEAARLLAGDKALAAGVYSVSTVQEEIGLRGAHTSAYRIHPDVGIAVDVTWATDQPDVKAARTGEVKLGLGPVITRGPNINPVVYERLVAAAKQAKIPYQVCAAPRGTGTDANAMQLSRGGVATGLVSVPNRYMHSPVEVCHLGDLENTAKLLAAFVRRLEAGATFIP
ncbi:MAG: M20/M25/M40 family metallo-hydrolase [Armatimonadetes bacterium]|nr:M20/M25/M40 family metallo-hydrolase [Armatimonadota bacterium]